MIIRNTVRDGDSVLFLDLDVLASKRIYIKRSRQCFTTYISFRFHISES